ncbi:MAG TPA: DUF433 domain-containing protein [Anaerolineae bacterium]|nr:DUF433 domain-containing protein [Anaerolineae bacterium]
MTTIRLSEHTYELLARRAQQVNRSPDALADEVLSRELQPAHPYIELETYRSRSRAVVKDAGTPVALIVGYARLGLAPEAFAEEVHPALTPAHVHDALSYYYDHRDAIDRELAEDSEQAARLRLREHMRSDEDYLKVTMMNTVRFLEDFR